MLSKNRFATQIYCSMLHEPVWFFSMAGLSVQAARIQSERWHHKSGISGSCPRCSDVIAIRSDCSQLIVCSSIGTQPLSCIISPRHPCRKCQRRPLLPNSPLHLLMEFFRQRQRASVGYPLVTRATLIGCEPHSNRIVWS